MSESDVIEVPKRVLVADDERHIAQLLRVNLERQGYVVYVVFDGQQALDELQRETFDMAVIDLMMPYVDGFQVLAWIRTHEATKNMKVVLMTAQAKEARLRSDLPYQPDIWVEKPFNPDEPLLW